MNIDPRAAAFADGLILSSIPNEYITAAQRAAMARFYAAAHNAVLDELARSIRNEGCTQECGVMGRYPPLPHGQSHWGNCAIALADAILGFRFTVAE